MHLTNHMVSQADSIHMTSKLTDSAGDLSVTDSESALCPPASRPFVSSPLALHSRLHHASLHLRCTCLVSFAILHLLSFLFIFFLFLFIYCQLFQMTFKKDRQERWRGLSILARVMATLRRSTNTIKKVVRRRHA